MIKGGLRCHMQYLLNEKVYFETIMFLALIYSWLLCGYEKSYYRLRKDQQ